MIFDSIFKAAGLFSDIGTAAEQYTLDYIPKGAEETDFPINIEPPHDPSKPFTPLQQDPKIVRETSPQAKGIFDFIQSVTLAIAENSSAQDKIFNDPSTTVSTASTIMAEADNGTKTYPAGNPEPRKKDDVVVNPPTNVELPEVREIPKYLSST